MRNIRFKKSYIAFAGAVVVLGAAVVGAAILLKPDAPLTLASSQQDQAVGIVSGLNPGDLVRYTILSNNKAPVTGEEKADENGQFKIPLFASEAAKQDVLYDLEVMQDGKPVNINLRMKPGMRDLKLSAQGLKAFSDIEIGKDEKRVETKADWAGAFSVDDLDIRDSLESLDSFRVALFSSDVLSDVRDNNPLVLEIITTEGGGGPTDEGVNDWEPPETCSGTRLSMCKEDNVNENIQDVVNNYVVSLQLMTDELSQAMIQYVEAIGFFIDAKVQLQTQTQLQAMQAQAHKDYEPSEQMCVFGSFVRSVAKVEEKSRFEQMAFNKAMMDRYTNTGDASGAIGPDIDEEARLAHFKRTYCNPADNGNGLQELCAYAGGVGAENPDRHNRDIDYARLTATPLTLEIDFEDAVTSEDEEDVLSLARNLYWPTTLRGASEDQMENNGENYMDARRLMALYNVSHNSLAHLISIKAAAPEVTLDENNLEVSGWSFMKAFLRDFGLSDEEIDNMLGERPSYYAQMEVLTKKIYQDPDFYTNLYDKPTNVDRIGAAMDAIRLMQMRDRFEVSTRLEMLASLLLEARITKDAERASAALSDSISD